MAIASAITLLLPAAASAATNSAQENAAQEVKATESDAPRAPKEMPADYDVLPEKESESQTSNCAEVRRDRDRLVKAGQDRAVCIEWGSPNESSKSKSLGSRDNGSVWCYGQKENLVYATRTELCSVRTAHLIVLELRTGRILGNAWGVIEQEIETQNGKPEFFEYLNFTLVDTDMATAAMTVSLTPVCSLDTSCKQSVDPWDKPRPVVEGRPVDGTISRLWTGNQGNKSFLLSYKMHVTIPAGSGTWDWGVDGGPGDGQYLVRCDNEVGATSGCVVPAFTPTFVVGEQYKQARAWIGLTQATMSSHPGWEGYGDPLHREGSEDEMNKNRAVICDSSFKPSDNTPNATCDEFPFARTKESGRRLGVTTGASCQQYTVVNQTVNGQDYLSLTWWGYPRPPIDAKCARASMPANQNSGVGGDLGRKTIQWRLLDNDPYWVDAGNTPPTNTP
ncbi:hypothetical protein ACFU6O_12090 [Streptomyces albidoflavus]|uniref:NucA/NucB deoxyribonuclease domain-containing protein n=1 Tax=Streptomyces albidoflavus TaxID=1886 RepID=UPI00344E6146